jgi:hypothetical protein
MLPEPLPPDEPEAPELPLAPAPEPAAGSPSASSSPLQAPSSNALDTSIIRPNLILFVFIVRSSSVQRCEHEARLKENVAQAQKTVTMQQPSTQ